MKSIILLKTGCLSLLFATVLLAQEVKLNIPAETAAPAPAPAPTSSPAVAKKNFTETQLLESFGWFVMAQFGIHELQLTPEQIVAFTRGVSLASANKEPPHDLQAIGPAMGEYIDELRAAALKRAKMSNLAAAATFFSSLKNRPGVVSLPDGLCYEILKTGTGPNAKMTDTVIINYKGMLLDGQVFDSSKQAGRPLTIALSDAMLGWAEGMQLINKGGKIKLYIPPQLAYGDEGAGAISPGSSLIFEIEVLDIFPTPMEQK